MGNEEEKEKLEMDRRRKVEAEDCRKKRKLLTRKVPISSFGFHLITCQTDRLKECYFLVSF